MCPGHSTGLISSSPFFLELELLPSRSSWLPPVITTVPKSGPSCDSSSNKGGTGGGEEPTTTTAVARGSPGIRWEGRGAPERSLDGGTEGDV
ncbi:hypothetical protein E2562_001550 [Oryza meyeriana var. granulata]|uniref:Uncharacterized protein n=1 Tax=Oryza meyeriana var. granulata TaxID=110450 RepID=A0A6G1DF84_9ORYZ|nr:hypothetical protein E2562_001550 [Oryza meyeriana var. granulata]